MSRLRHWLLKLTLLFVVVLVFSGCASDLKLGVATNQAPRAPEEPPH